jgi:hypothetical protein
MLTPPLSDEMAQEAVDAHHQYGSKFGCSGLGVTDMSDLVTRLRVEIDQEVNESMVY